MLLHALLPHRLLEYAMQPTSTTDSKMQRGFLSADSHIPKEVADTHLTNLVVALLEVSSSFLRLKHTGNAASQILQALARKANCI
jgi:hypothetical protein